MTILEFMTFVSLVCNLESPISQVSSLKKMDCMEYYTNCAIRDDKDTVDRLRVSNCNLNAKKASRKWGI